MKKFIVLISIIFISGCKSVTVCPDSYMQTSDGKYVKTFVEVKF